jgi:hypothetical protein
MPESPWPQRRDVAQAVEITAPLPTVARSSERRENPIRARSRLGDTRQPRKRRARSKAFRPR